MSATIEGLPHADDPLLRQDLWRASVEETSAALGDALTANAQFRHALEDVAQFLRRCPGAGAAVVLGRVEMTLEGWK